MRKINHLLAVLASVLVLAGCSTVNKKTKVMSGEELLEKAKDAVCYSGELDNYNSYEVIFNILVLCNNERVVRNVEVYYQKPDKYLFRLENVINEPGKNSRDEQLFHVNNGKIMWKNHNGQNVRLNEVGEGEHVDIQEKIGEYKALATFSIFVPQYELRLSPKKFIIDGYTCYKLSSMLGDRSREGSDKYTYYIDVNNYLIRKIESEYGNTQDITYKKFGNEFLPYKYKYVERGINVKVFYITISSFKVNHETDKSIFINLHDKKGRNI